MGLWKKGESGNKSGRPKQYAEVVALVRSKTKENIDGICKLAEQAEDHNVQLRARQYLHEIAWGKPAQTVAVTGENGGPLVVQWIQE